MKVYSYLAAFCVLMAFVTCVLPHLNQEAIIALMAVVALVTHIGGRTLATGKDAAQRHFSSASAILSLVPVLMGILLHARATSRLVQDAGFGYGTTGWFVGAMLVVAVANRISAYLCRHENPKLSASYFMFSAAGVIIAAAGLLRQFELMAWSQQAPLLMMIPLAYLIASRLYRGEYAERPLQLVSQAATVVILFGVFWAALERDPTALFVSVTGATTNLLLAVAFLEACAFYVLAAFWQQRAGNVFGATAAGCAAIWQLLGYFGLPTVWYPLMFAVAGVGLLLAARSLGLRMVNRFQVDGEVLPRLRGRGLTSFRSGNAVLTVALIAAFMKGLGQLGSSSLDLVGVELALPDHRRLRPGDRPDSVRFWLAAVVHHRDGRLGRCDGFDTECPDRFEWVAETGNLPGRVRSDPAHAELRGSIPRIRARRRRECHDGVGSGESARHRTAVCLHVLGIAGMPDRRCGTRSAC